MSNTICDNNTICSNDLLVGYAQSQVSVDVASLPGWASLSTGSHNITIVAKADGYRDSEPSAAVSVTKQGGGGTVEMPNISNWTATKISGDFAGTLTLYTTNNDGNKIQCGPKGYEWITKINNMVTEITFSDVASIFGITQDSDGNNIITSEWGFNSAFDNRVTNDGLDGGSCIMKIDTNGLLNSVPSTDVRVLVYDAITDTMRVDTCEVNEIPGELTTKYAYGFNQIFGTIMRIGDVVVKAGTYRFNEELTSAYSSYVDQELNFTSNSQSCFAIGLDAEDTGSPIDTIRYGIEAEADYIEVYYSNGGWTNASYKTIIVETDQIVGDEFYTWFTTNTTKLS